MLRRFIEICLFFPVNALSLDNFQSLWLFSFPLKLFEYNDRYLSISCDSQALTHLLRYADVIVGTFLDAGVFVKLVLDVLSLFMFLFEESENSLKHLV
jgi:hypothetical protein